MLTTEFTCRRCGGEWEGNLFTVTTQGQRMALVFCPACREQMVDSEGQNAPATHGNASYARVCQECGKSYAPTKTWQKYCSNACRYRKYITDHPRSRK